MQKWWFSKIYTRRYRPPTTNWQTSTRIQQKILDFRNDSSPFRFSSLLSLQLARKEFFPRCKFYFSTDYSRILGMRVVWTTTRGLVFPRYVKENEQRAMRELNDIGKRTYEAFVNRVDENNGHARLLFLTMEEERGRRILSKDVFRISKYDIQYSFFFFYLSKYQKRIEFEVKLFFLDGFEYSTNIWIFEKGKKIVYK